MNGYLKNFEKQIQTLNDVYYELLQPIDLDNWWVFGGGTALSMFHFQHRKSFDIDIFITVFDFLDPKWFIDESDLFDNINYRFNNHLALKTKDDIKVDFLINESIIKNNILGLDFTLYIESIEDIIAKKIRWRKEDNLARDIFDIALAISKDEQIFQNLIDSRFIGFDDLEKLTNALDKLDKKIEPERDNYKSVLFLLKKLSSIDGPFK